VNTGACNCCCWGEGGAGDGPAGMTGKMVAGRATACRLVDVVAFAAAGGAAVPVAGRMVGC
jgi:hypothetical protein